MTKLITRKLEDLDHLHGYTFTVENGEMGITEKKIKEEAINFGVLHAESVLQALESHISEEIIWYDYRDEGKSDDSPCMNPDHDGKSATKRYIFVGEYVFCRSCIKTSPKRLKEIADEVET